MACRRICFINMKGGSNKTSGVWNVAHGLKRKGFRVLCLDLDAQSNLTQAFNVKPSSCIDRNMNQVLKKQIKPEEAIINVDGIDIIPSNIGLSFTELELFGATRKEYILCDVFNDNFDKWDYVLMDTAPNLLVLTQCALSLANEIIIPCICEYFCMEGCGQLLSFIKTKVINEKINPNIKVTGAYITNYDTRKTLTKDVEEQYKKIFGNLLFNTRIKTNVAVAECVSYHQSIFDYKPDKSQDYENLVDEIIQRGNN